MTFPPIKTIACALGATFILAGTLPAHAMAQSADAPRTNPDAEGLSKAQTLLFNRPHLRNIKDRTTLRYDFERKGIFHDDFTDRVLVHIMKVRDDGKKDVSFDFFSGKHHQAFQDEKNFAGNPLIMLYLQRSVYDMHASLNASANYLRTTVLKAFYSEAKVSDVTLDGPDGKIEGHKITMQPFKTGAHASQMGPYADLTYEFVISPDVPGEVYSMSTYVPTTDKLEKTTGKPYTLKEKLVFASAHKLTQSSDAREAGSDKQSR